MYLDFVNMICNVTLILLFWNISPPSGHKLHVLEVALLSFEFEVAIDCNIEGIEEPFRT